MPRSTRYRQLRRLAERRQAEKRDAAAIRRRRLNRIAIGLGSAVLIVAVVAAGSALLGGGGSGSASPSSVPSFDFRGNVTGSAAPDTQINNAIRVTACGGTVPADRRRPKDQYAAPDEVLTDGATYYAHIDTSCGEIVIELLADTAPQAVNSFVFLAQQGFFDALRFHRISTGITIIQGGDPVGLGTGGPGYTFPDELDGTETYGPGTVAMANAGPDTNGSQFFIVYGSKATVLSPSYTVFGRVVKGLAVARKIAAVPVLGAAASDPNWAEQPSQMVWIYSVKITDAP